MIDDADELEQDDEDAEETDEGSCPYCGTSGDCKHLLLLVEHLPIA